MPMRASIRVVFVASLAGAVVSPLLPVYAADSLGAGLGMVGIVVAAPLVGLVLIQPLAGQAGDHFGGRVLVFIGLAVFAGATAIYAVIPSLSGLVAFRILSGMGSGLVVVGTLKVVVDESPRGRRGESLSIYSLATNSASAAGPLLGSALAAATSFRMAVILSALMAILGFAPARRVPPPSSGPIALRTFRVSATGLAHRQSFLPSAVLAVGFVGAAVVFTLVPVYLSRMGSGRAGTALACFALAITAVRLLGRQLPDRIGHRACSVVALTLIGVGLGLMAFAATPTGVLIATSVVGIGHGFAYPALVAYVTLWSSDRERATALGTFTAATHVGFVAWCVGTGLLASLVGMQTTFALAGVAAISGVAVASRLAPSHRVT